MMSYAKFANLLAIPVCVAFAGCATIVGSPTQPISVASTPSEATITVVDEAGVEVFKGATPSTVILKKHAGGYWAKKSYTVTVAREGFKPQSIPVTASANGWYIVGNFFIGGAIGWFAVDPFNGNMYTLSPETIAANLSKGLAHNNGATDGSISIVLLEDVPPNLKDRLIRVN
jgi:hypothetical protein